MSASPEGENAFQNVEFENATPAQNITTTSQNDVVENSLPQNSVGASPLSDVNNSLNRPETTTEEPTTTQEQTTTQEPTTTREQLEELNYSAVNKTKKRRSTKQSEADAGQKEMLELLRGIYNKEFAEIPEKYRPKPKAYVARAAWYKKGSERNSYIQSWVLKDKNAANARMSGRAAKKSVKENMEVSNTNVLDTLPSIVSESVGSAEKFKPSTDTLKQRAKKAIHHMNEITDRAHDQLMKRIKQPVVRKTANYLFKETRKLTKRLAAEINTQTRHLQQAAREYIRHESKAAKSSIERQADANLTAALGRRPAKRMTHRLTRLRNSGSNINVKNFLNAENKEGRIPKTLKNKWKTSIPENATPLNTYND